MASVASYKYLADNLVTYQVVLPSDFATVLGYVAADGTEPYLPAYISPRYVTYESIPALVWVQVVVTDPLIFAAPPADILVGGIYYKYISAIAQAVARVQGGNVMLIAGPQGPQGTAGTPGTIVSGTNSFLTHDKVLTLANTEYTDGFTFSQSQDLFVTAFLTAVSGASGGSLQAVLYDNFGNSAAAEQTFPTTSARINLSMTCCCKVTPTSGLTLKYQCNGAGATIKASTDNYSNASGLCYITIQ